MLFEVGFTCIDKTCISRLFVKHCEQTDHHPAMQRHFKKVEAIEVLHCTTQWKNEVLTQKSPSLDILNDIIQSYQGCLIQKIPELFANGSQAQPCVTQWNCTSILQTSPAGMELSGPLVGHWGKIALCDTNWSLLILFPWLNSCKIFRIRHHYQSGSLWWNRIKQISKGLRAVIRPTTKNATYSF